MGGKMGPYEEDVRLPLYVRGPGVPKSVRMAHLVSNVDYLPTWMDLAGELHVKTMPVQMWRFASVRTLHSIMIWSAF